MRRLLSSLIAATVLLALPAAADARTQIVTVQLAEPRVQLPLIERLGLDLTHRVDRRSADVVIHAEADKALLRRHGLPFSVRVADVAAANRAARRLDRAYAARVQRSALPSGRLEYRELADYLREMDDLASARPDLVRRVTLPRKTVMGKPITGVEIAKDVNRTDDGRPVYVVMGVHHAREWPSAEVSLEFALDLVANYGKDPRITGLLERERIVVIPIVNVDGFEVSRGNQQADPQFEATANAGDMKRKNCAVNTPAEEGEECRNRSGVDLNRNYGAYWGGNGASSVFVMDDFRGPSPWSEPEAAAVHELTQRLQVTNLQTIHNVAGLVLRPPGFRAQGLAPDEARLKALGDAMGDATGYSSEYGYQLYEVTGATEDWNYVAQGAFGYTIELGGEDFHDAYKLHVIDQYLGTPGTEQEGRGTREALLLAAEQAANPVDHAVLTGDAPPGMTLRLRKDFKTLTSPVCPVDVGTVDSLTGQVSTQAGAPYVSSCPVGLQTQEIDDFLDTTTVVPADGRFTWHVNPSTRPFEGKAGRTEAWTLTCERAGLVLERRQVVVGRGQTVNFAGLCGGGPAQVSATPPDPFFAPFEAELKRVSGATRSVRFGIARALRPHARWLRKKRRLGIAYRLAGASLRDVTVEIRRVDGRTVARAKRSRLAPGRGRMYVRLGRHGLRKGRYRALIKGFTIPSGALVSTSKPVIVR
jgi:hypothetical protein